MVQLASYLRCVLCKTHLIFPRINGPNIDLQEFFGPFRLFGLGLCNGWPRKATLDLDPEFFSGVRTPALNDYVSRRPSYLLESIERLHQSSFISYLYRSSKPLHTEKAGSKGTGMASKVARQESTLRRIWTRKRARRERSEKGRHCRALRKNPDGVYDSNEREGRPKKELVHFNPLALSMFRRNASAHGEVDLLKEVQGSEGQTTVHSRNRRI